MNENDNQKKVIDLFNKMQKAIINNYTELNYPYKCLAFKYYKIHIETLNSSLKNNLLGKMSLKVFRQLFEGENNFKNYEEEKAEYINILIDSIKSNNSIIAQSNINKIIGKIYREQKNITLRKLIIILKGKANIAAELYYLFIIYLKERGFKLADLIENLVLILKDKYPDSIFEFTNIDSNDISFNDFINKLYNAIENKMLDNYTHIKFDKKSKNIIYNEFSIDYIYNVIQSTSDKDEKNKINNINNVNNNPTNKSKKNKNKKNKKKNINDKNNKNNINENSDNITQKKVKENDNGIYKNKNDEEKNLILEENNNNNNKNTKNEIEIKKTKEKEDDSVEKKIEQLKEELNIVNRKYEEIKHENEVIRNENEVIRNENKEIRNENEEIKKKNMENTKKILKLEFELKIIGLRSALKTLIDLFIYIFDCDESGNLERKINTLNKFCNKNKNSIKIKNLINDLDFVIEAANIKAHNINLKNNLFDELCENLTNYLEDEDKCNSHKNIICLLNKLNIERDFKELVIIRNNKYKMKNYDEKVRNIIKNIKNNPLIKDGNAIKNLISVY